MFYKMNHSKNFTPGFIMVLHTFGRNLKWNPHIHCLISEGGYSDDGYLRHITHFNYTYLRNAFRTALLNGLESRLGRSFKKSKLNAMSNINTVFMFMPSLTNMIPISATAPFHFWVCMTCCLFKLFPSFYRQFINADISCIWGTSIS